MTCAPRSKVLECSSEKAPTVLRCKMQLLNYDCTRRYLLKSARQPVGVLASANLQHRETRRDKLIHFPGRVQKHFFAGDDAAIE